MPLCPCGRRTRRVFASSPAGCALVLLLAGLLAPGTAAASERRVARIAGTGLEGSSGDGGPAREASFGAWVGIAVDPAGNVFVADTMNHRIRRVDAATGRIEGIAGTGVRGFGGDGGPAAAATLGRVQAIAVGRLGTLYLADADNGRIRRIGPRGRIATVAGNGTVAGDPSISLLPQPAVRATILKPTAVAADARGIVYFSSWLAAPIWRLDPRGTLLWIAGRPGAAEDRDGDPARAAALDPWVTLAAARGGTLYVAERDRHRVRAISGNPARIRVVAGSGIGGFAGDGGQARRARLRAPTAVAVDGAGNLFVADRGNGRIRRIDAASGTIETVAGAGTAGCGGREGRALDTPICPEDLAVDAAGNLYFTEWAPYPVVMRVEASP